MAAVLGPWVDVDNQLARIAPVLSAVGVWVRFKRDTGMPPRLGVVNPATRPEFTVRGEVTASHFPDGAGWEFRYHAEPGGLPLPLGADAVTAAVRVAHLLGVVPPERQGGNRPVGGRRGARREGASARYGDA